MRPRALHRRLTLAFFGAITIGLVFGTGLARAEDTTDMTSDMSTEYFAVMIALELIVIGILAIVVVYAALLLWDWIIGRFR